MARKHDRKKRSSPVMWSFVLTLLLIAAVSAALGLFRTSEEPASQPESLPEPEPVGTPVQTPMVDQRPVPSAASAPSDAGAPAAPADTTDPDSGVQADAPSAPDDSAPPEGAGQPGTTQGIDAKDGEQMVRGVILYATTSSVTIQTADGTKLSFLRETADVTGRLVEEAEIEVYYVGSISGTDTSAAFVTRIIAFA